MLFSRKSVTNSSIPQKVVGREDMSCCSMFGTTHSGNRCGRDPRTEDRIYLEESCCSDEVYSSRLGMAPHFLFHPQWPFQKKRLFALQIYNPQVSDAEEPASARFFPLLGIESVRGLSIL